MNPEKSALGLLPLVCTTKINPGKALKSLTETNSHNQIIIGSPHMTSTLLGRQIAGGDINYVIFMLFEADDKECKDCRGDIDA